MRVRMSVTKSANQRALQSCRADNNNLVLCHPSAKGPQSRGSENLVARAAITLQSVNLTYHVLPYNFNAVRALYVLECTFCDGFESHSLENVRKQVHRHPLLAAETSFVPYDAETSKS
jgi:hypothetical protein